MGNKQEVVKKEIDQLFNCSSKDEFDIKVNRVLGLEMPAQDFILSIFPFHIRQCLTSHYTYVSEMFQKIINKLQSLIDQQANGQSIHSSFFFEIRNSLLLLSKFIPVLNEDQFNKQTKELLWVTGKQEIKNTQGHRIEIIQENDNNDTEFQFKPNILRLCDILINLCFVKGFTIANEPTEIDLNQDAILKEYVSNMSFHKEVDFKEIWRGFSDKVKYANDSLEFVENRLVILHCLLAIFSMILYRPKRFTINNTEHLTPLIIHPKKGDKFTFTDVDEGNYYLNLNSSLMYFLQSPLIHKFTVSLLGVTLHQKQQFYWFQDNHLIIKKLPKVLANLSAQVLLFLLSLQVNEKEIDRQISFNYEIRSIDKYVHRQKLSDPQQEDDQEPITQSGQDFYKNEVLQLFQHIESKEFLQAVMYQIKENLFIPIKWDNSILSIKTFSLEGSQEYLGLLYFMFTQNKNTIKIIQEEDIEDIISIILYYQAKYIEGFINYNCFLISSQLMQYLSKYSIVYASMSAQLKVNIPTNKIPSLGNTIGNSLINLYSYILLQDYQQQKKYYNHKVSNTKFDVTIFPSSTPQVNTIQQFKTELISLIIFNVSPYIKNLTKQSSELLAEVFYCHLNYDYLFQQPKNAYNLNNLTNALINILSYDFASNNLLLYSILKQAKNLEYFYAFRVNKKFLDYFFLKINKLNTQVVVLQTEQSELNRNQNKINIPSNNVSQLKEKEEEKEEEEEEKREEKKGEDGQKGQEGGQLEEKGQVEEEKKQEEKKEEEEEEKKESKEEEKKQEIEQDLRQTSNRSMKKIIQLSQEQKKRNFLQNSILIEYKQLLSAWKEIFELDFVNESSRKLQEILFMCRKLLRENGVNLQSEDISSYQRLVDQFQLVLSPQLGVLQLRQIYQDKFSFESYCLGCIVLKQEWTPYYDSKLCLYFH